MNLNRKDKAGLKRKKLKYLVKYPPDHFKREKNIKKFKTKYFGYNPYKEVQRSSMFHQGFSKKKVLFKFDSLKQFLREIMKEKVGCFIKNKTITKDMLRALDKIRKSSLTIGNFKKLFYKYVGRRDKILGKHVISQFARFTIEKCIPYKVFGNKKDLKTFGRNIKRLILADYKHVVLLNHLMKGLNRKTSKIQRNIRAKIVLWISKMFIIKLFGSLFYVVQNTKKLDNALKGETLLKTIKDGFNDKGKCRELMFFEPFSWRAQEKKALDELIKDGHISPIDIHQYDTSLCYLHLIPKHSGNGLRPLIIKSYDQKHLMKRLKRCNIFLKQLLATKTGHYPNIISDLHQEWLSFCDKCTSRDEIYFIKTDIRDAYGSIIHKKLKLVLKELIDGLNQTLLSLKECSYQGIWYPIHTEQFNELPQSINQKIIKENNVDKVIAIESLQNFIHYYIDNINVLIPSINKTFKFIKGLPQGGSLSGVLCEIYYNALDREFINVYNKEEGDIFLRAVDDYLFVTKNKIRALRFLELMEAGFPEYGVVIQKDKTLTNLKDNSSIVPYFGYELNVKTKQIVSHLDTYRDVQIASTMSFKTQVDIKVLEQRLLMVHTLKLSKLVLDSRYLCKRTILTNVFSASCILALRYDGIVTNHLSKPEKENSKLLYNCIMRATTLIAMNVMGKCSKGKGRSGRIEFVAVKTVAVKGFIIILKNNHLHKQVVNKLQLSAHHTLPKLNCRDKRVIQQVSEKIPHPLETCVC